MSLSLYGRFTVMNFVFGILSFSYILSGCQDDSTSSSEQGSATVQSSTDEQSSLDEQSLPDEQATDSPEFGLTSLTSPSLAKIKVMPPRWIGLVVDEYNWKITGLNPAAIAEIDRAKHRTNYWDEMNTYGGPGKAINAPNTGWTMQALSSIRTKVVTSNPTQSGQPYYTRYFYVCPAWLAVKHNDGTKKTEALTIIKDFKVTLQNRTTAKIGGAGLTQIRMNKNQAEEWCSWGVDPEDRDRAVEWSEYTAKFGAPKMLSYELYETDDNLQQTHRAGYYLAKTEVEIVGITSYLSGRDLVQVEKQVKEEMVLGQEVSASCGAELHRFSVDANWCRTELIDKKNQFYNVLGSFRQTLFDATWNNCQRRVNRMRDFFRDKALKACSLRNVRNMDWEYKPGGSRDPNEELGPGLAYFLTQAKSDLQNSLNYAKKAADSKAANLDTLHASLKRIGRCSVEAGFGIAELLATEATLGAYPIMNASLGVTGVQVPSIKDGVNGLLGFSRDMNAFSQTDLAPTNASKCTDKILDNLCSASVAFASTNNFWGKSTGLESFRNARIKANLELYKSMKDRTAANKLLSATQPGYDGFNFLCFGFNAVDKLSEPAGTINECVTNNPRFSAIYNSYKNNAEPTVKRLKDFCALAQFEFERPGPIGLSQ